MTRYTAPLPRRGAARPGRRLAWPRCCAAAPTCSPPCRTISPSSPPAPGPGPPSSARWSGSTGSRCRPPRRWRWPRTRRRTTTLLGAADRRRTGDPGGHGARALPRALGTLRDQALVWGGDDRLRLVRTARELLAPVRPAPVADRARARPSPRPRPGCRRAGSRRSSRRPGCPPPTTRCPRSAALTALFTDRERMAALLDTAPAEALAVLDRLVWGPPYGEVTAEPDRRRCAGCATAGCCCPTAPRHGRAAARGGAASARRAARTACPSRCRRAVGPRAATHRPQVVDSDRRRARRYTALSTVEELLKDWDEGGPPVLRAGGLSVRDLKRTAAALDTTEPIAAFWVELAYAAGLLASDGEADERYAPTPAYDEWLRAARRRALGAARRGLADRDPHGGPGRRPGRQGPHARPRSARTSTAPPRPRSATASWTCSPRCPRARPPTRSPCSPGSRWERPAARHRPGRRPARPPRPWTLPRRSSSA